MKPNKSSRDWLFRIKDILQAIESIEEYNVLIHEYFGVNLSTVWQTVQTRLPVLKQQLLALIE